MARIQLSRDFEGFRVRLKASPHGDYGTRVPLSRIRSDREVGGAAPVKAAGGEKATFHVRPASTVGAVTRGALLPPQFSAHQRVAVKVRNISRKGGGRTAAEKFARNLSNQVAYNTRDDSESRRAGLTPFEAFSAGQDDVDAKAMVSRWTGDQRAWSIVLPPENGDRIADFKGYVRDTVDAWQRDILTPDELKAGKRLEWVAAVHTDTDHIHAHVLIRGRIDDHDLRLKETQILNSFEYRAREVATRAIGHDLTEHVARDRMAQTLVAPSLKRGVTGWRIHAVLNDPGGARAGQVSRDLREAGMPAKFNRRNGELIVFAGDYDKAIEAARLIERDSAEPSIDSRLRGMRLGDGPVYAAFQVADDDPRYSDRGVAGIPLMHDDVRRINAANDPFHRTVLVDRALFRANEDLSMVHGDKLFGSADVELPTEGWVVAIHTGRHAGNATESVMATLAEMGVQARVSTDAATQQNGTPAVSVIAYAGSREMVDEIRVMVAATVDPGNLAMTRKDERVDPVGRGVDAWFVPGDDTTFSRRHYEGGVPLMVRDGAESIRLFGREQVRDFAAQALDRTHGGYFRPYATPHSEIQQRVLDPQRGDVDPERLSQREIERRAALRNEDSQTASAKLVAKAKDVSRDGGLG